MKKILKFCSVILLVILVFSFWHNLAKAKEVGACKPCGDATKDKDTCLPNLGLSCIEGQCQDVNKITFCSFSQKEEVHELVDEVSKWMMIVALVVAPLMILLGGFYILTAAGDKSRFAKGRTIIVWAVIGLAIFLFAKAFISILKSFLW